MVCQMRKCGCFPHYSSMKGDPGKLASSRRPAVLLFHPGHLWLIPLEVSAQQCSQSCTFQSPGKFSKIPDMGLNFKDSGVMEQGWVQAWQFLEHFQGNSKEQPGFRTQLCKNFHPIHSSGSRPGSVTITCDTNRFHIPASQFSLLYTTREVDSISSLQSCLCSETWKKSRPGDVTREESKLGASVIEQKQPVFFQCSLEALLQSSGALAKSLASWLQRAL